MTSYLHLNPNWLAWETEASSIVLAQRMGVLGVDGDVFLFGACNTLFAPTTVLHNSFEERIVRAEGWAWVTYGMDMWSDRPCIIVQRRAKPTLIFYHVEHRMHKSNAWLTLIKAQAACRAFLARREVKRRRAAQAVSMALHPRLGADSILQTLPADLLAHLVHRISLACTTA